MMRISTSWLNDYVDISDENLKELAAKITNAGVNVETVEEYNTPNLVVGQILEIEDHPDSDHLQGRCRRRGTRNRLRSTELKEKHESYRFKSGLCIARGF